MEFLEKEEDGDAKQELVFTERGDVARSYDSSTTPLCFMFHQLVKSLLKCFCQDEASSDDEQSRTLSDPDEANVNIDSLRRRPPRSGLSTGSGGQIN